MAYKKLLEMMIDEGRLTNERLPSIINSRSFDMVSPLFFAGISGQSQIRDYDDGPRGAGAPLPDVADF